MGRKRKKVTINLGAGVLSKSDAMLTSSNGDRTGVGNVGHLFNGWVPG